MDTVIQGVAGRVGGMLQVVMLERYVDLHDLNNLHQCQMKILGFRLEYLHDTA